MFATTYLQGKSKEADYENQSNGEGKGLGLIFVPEVFFSR